MSWSEHHFDEPNFNREISEYFFNWLTKFKCTDHSPTHTKLQSLLFSGGRAHPNVHRRMHILFTLETLPINNYMLNLMRLFCSENYTHVHVHTCPCSGHLCAATPLAIRMACLSLRCFRCLHRIIAVVVGGNSSSCSLHVKLTHWVDVVIIIIAAAADPRLRCLIKVFSSQI